MLRDWWYRDGTTRTYVRVLAKMNNGAICAPWIENRMRIPDEFLTNVFYMYRSLADAATGDKRGGTGFLVGVPIEGTKLVMTYCVTARHVITDGYRTLRFNTRDGQLKPVEVPEDGWFWPDTGADVAVACVIAPWPAVDAVMVPISKCVTRDQYEKFGIGIGDPVFMVGRLRYHEGKALNTPAARFGAISMSPGEPIYNAALDNEQVSFVVEMRSIGGYSGSPVFVYRPGKEIKLLGVDWGHLFERTMGGTKENANMACVVPAWELADLLLSQGEFVKAREKYAQGILDDDDVGVALDAAVDDSRPGPDPERLRLEGSLEDVAKRVVDAGRPDGGGHD